MSNDNKIRLIVFIVGAFMYEIISIYSLVDHHYMTSIAIWLLACVCLLMATMICIAEE